MADEETVLTPLIPEKSPQSVDDASIEDSSPSSPSSWQWYRYKVPIFVDQS